MQLKLSLRSASCLFMKGLPGSNLEQTKENLVQTSNSLGFCETSYPTRLLLSHSLVTGTISFTTIKIFYFRKCLHLEICILKYFPEYL